MSIKPIKAHLNFAGSNMIREQKSSEGYRSTDGRSRIDNLYGEINKKDTFLTNIYSSSNEWKEKYEELVKENSILRAKLIQYNEESFEKIKEIYETQIQKHLSEIEKYKQKSLKHESENKETNELLEHLKRNFIDIKRNSDLFTQENESLRIELIEKNKTIKEFSNQIQEFSKTDALHNAEMFKLIEEIGRKHKENQNMKIEHIKNVNNIIKEKDELINEITNEIERFKKQNCIYQERISTIESIITIKDQHIASLNNENQSFNQRIKELESTYRDNNEIFEALHIKNIQYSKIEKELIMIKDIHQNCDKEKINVIEYNEIKEKLIENEEKLKKCQEKIKECQDKFNNNSSLFISLKEKILKFITLLESTSTLTNLLALFETDSFDSLFSLIHAYIIAINTENSSLKSISILLEQGKQDALSQLSVCKSENFSLLENLKKLSQYSKDFEKYEENLKNLENKIQNEININEMKEKKITSLKNKIEKLQQEIKSSFSKIDILKSQLALNEKNLILIQQLQELSRQDSLQKIALREQNNQHKHKIEELENELSKRPIERQLTKKLPNDPNSLLLQKIVSMKSELEQYNPSENATQQELRHYKTSLSNISFSLNKIEFVLKCIDDEFTCKKCLKFENSEFSICGHFNCMTCDKICKKCNEEMQKINTNLFYFLFRKINDIKKGLHESKNYTL